MLKVCNWAGFQEFEPLFGCDELLKISFHYSTIPVVHSTVYTLPLKTLILNILKSAASNSLNFLVNNN